MLSGSSSSYDVGLTLRLILEIPDLFGLELTTSGTFQERRIDESGTRHNKTTSHVDRGSRATLVDCTCLGLSDVFQRLMCSNLTCFQRFYELCDGLQSQPRCSKGRSTILVDGSLNRVRMVSSWLNE